MSALVSTHKPGRRLAELSPFGLDAGEPSEHAVSAEARSPVPESAYGCVEWFQYLDHPAVSVAVPAAAPRPRDSRRP
jgi:hypothetical protein